MMTGLKHTQLYLTSKAVRGVLDRTARTVDRIIKSQPEGTEIALVCVLKGALPFFQGVVNRLDSLGRTEQEFIKISSYKNNQQQPISTIQLIGEVDLRGKTVIVFEDIIDTGKSLVALGEALKLQDYGQIFFVSMLSRVSLKNLVINYRHLFPLFHVGHFVPEGIGYLTGFGLDDKDKWRELDHIREII